MQILKLYTTFVYGLFSEQYFHNDVYDFILIGKMLLTQVNQNAKEVVWPIQGERKTTLLCFSFLKKSATLSFSSNFLLDKSGR